MVWDILIFASSFGFVGILLYVMMRYGPVSHTWMRIPKDQQKRIEQANKEYQRNYPALRKMKPTGKALYKKALVSHNGLAIYQDGIYAKFCVGYKGKYKFKPFDMISDIFPVEVENPFAKADSVLMGLKSWKELQIEILDYETFIIDSRKHDFEIIVPIIKDAMMGKWDQVYRETEVIRGNFLEGNIGWHTFLRGRSKPEEIRKEEKFAEMEKLPKDKSRGSLLFEEPPEVVRMKVNAMNKLGVLLLILGIVFLILTVLNVTYFDVPEVCIFSTTVFLILFCVVFMIFAIILFRVAKWRKSIKVYEHGVTNFLVGTGDEFFIPYGYFKGMKEGSNRFEGEYHVLEAKDPRYNVNLSKKIPDLERHLEYIRGQIGRPDLDYPIEITGLKPMLRKFEYVAYVIMIVLSVILGYYFSFTALSDIGERYVIIGFGALFSVICIFATFAVGLKFIKIYKTNKSEKGIDLKVIGAIFIVTLLFFSATTYYTYNIISEDPRLKIKKDAMPQSGISLDSLSNNSNAQLNDNLVLNDDNLVLYNTTLIFDCTRSKEFSFWVGENSYLELIECTIQSSDESYGFAFEIYGSANIVNTTIMNLWGDVDHENWDGGVEIYSDTVSIIGCTISDGKTNGILIHECSPVISGNTIMDCPDDGMEIHYSEVIISDNIITGCGWAIIVWPESEVRIQGNTIQDNTYGISIQSSSAVIENNRFIRNTEYAVNYNDESDVVLESNYYEGNGEDVSEFDDWIMLMFQACTIGIFIMAIIFFLILLSMQKKNFGKKKENDEERIDEVVKGKIY